MMALPGDLSVAVDASCPGFTPALDRRSNPGFHATMSDMVAVRSIAVRASPSGDAEMVTEVVCGERLVVLGRRGGWLRVVVPEHASHLDPGGYPGWVDAGDGLVERGAWEPAFVVVGENRACLPLGALLGEDEGKAVLPDGRPVEVDAGVLRRVGDPVGIGGHHLCLRLLGLPYRWGGTDSTRGMDCSGLVMRAMQLRGIRVPRDAEDQFASAPFRSGESWERARVGDLVFFGEEITHVGFYLGDGCYVSAKGEDGGVSVRRVSEDGYVGFARYGGGCGEPGAAR